MWELDHKEDGVMKNWCFWTVVLEKTLESLLDCKEIKPVNPKGVNWKSLSRVQLFVTPWNSPGQNTGVGSLSLLQGIFPTQGSKPDLPHGRWIPYQLSRKGSPKGNQSWIFTGRTDAEAETPILWPTDTKSWLIGKDPDAGKDWRQEEKGMTEDKMVGWHHQLNGHEFEQIPGDSEGPRSLARCSP